MSLYQRAADIVLTALDLAPAERVAHVDRACGNDTALRREVNTLLDAHDRADQFLETPPIAPDIDDAPLVAGDVLGAYRIVGLLGEGGMGVVYLAEDTRLGRTVALKSVRPRFAEDPAWRERLRKEARAAAALTHPNVATVYALEDIDGRLLLATEHVAGETLREALARGPLGHAAARAIGRQLADAVAAAHDRGVVHRDLKPENVMRTADGSVKILDFGLAHLDAVSASEFSPALTQEGAVFGTPAYMAPEQLRGEHAGPPADIFALGVMLAELTSGRHPFAGTNPAATVARSLSAEPDLGSLPAPFADVLRRALAKSVADRFPSAHALRDALASPAGAPPSPSHALASARWWWQFDLAAVSVISIALAVAVWAMRDVLAPPSGLPIVLATIVSALAATTLRLHLAFTARIYPTDAAAQHRRVMPWIKIVSTIQAASVAVAGLQLPDSHSMAMALLIASAVVLLVSSLVIGPATARAAQLD